jgi:hypothetical protein
VLFKVAAVRGSGAWQRCVAAVRGSGAWQRCVAAVRGSGAWQRCVAAVRIPRIEIRVLRSAIAYLRRHRKEKSVFVDLLTGRPKFIFGMMLFLIFDIVYYQGHVRRADGMNTIAALPFEAPGGTAKSLIQRS